MGVSEYPDDDPESEATRTVEHGYDAQNRWIKTSLDADGAGAGAAVDRFFVYDGNQIVLQLDDSGEATHRYLWGPAVDQLLADEEVSDEVTWPLTDHLGTIRDWAAYDDGLGETTVVNHILYDAFGRITDETNPADHLFYFTARPLEKETNLQNNLHRWYEAPTGTWLSEDPIGFEADDGNLYRYVGNGPTISTDPSGLDRIEAIYNEETNRFDLYYIDEFSVEGSLPVLFINRLFSSEGEPEYVGTIDNESDFVWLWLYEGETEADRRWTTVQQVQEHSRAGGTNWDKFRKDPRFTTPKRPDLMRPEDVPRGAFAGALSARNNLLNEIEGRKTTPEDIDAIIAGAGAIGDLADAALNFYLTAPLSLAEKARVLSQLKYADRVTYASGNVTNVVRYGPMKPGPLSWEVGQTFRSHSYTAGTLSKSTILYRVWGGPAGKIGPYWTRVKPAGRLQSQLDSALAFGNTAEHVVKIRVPAGTTIYEGITAPQNTALMRLLGGGNQVYIPKVNPGWVVP